MFKNAIIYRISSLFDGDIRPANEALAANNFQSCHPSQEKSSGWVEPRGYEHGTFVEVIGGQWILKLMTETKTVPGDVVTRKAKARAAEIEACTGRKPGKKETREIKEDIRRALLVHAFPKRSETLVWIDPHASLMVIDATSQSKADEVVTMLVKCLLGLAVRLIETQVPPAAAMSKWLITQEPPPGFSVDRECELKAADESKATIKYGRHPLDIDEVKANVAAGKLPTKLAMTWDSRVSFVLTEGLHIKKLAFLDVVFDTDAGKADGFDGDVGIATGELSKMIPDLLDVLGGEVVA